MAKNRWPQLCELFKSDDQLPTRKVGPWTEDKLFFWNRYIEITTSAMVGHPKWPAGLVYVDLFAGPGICELEESGRRIPGSILIAANAPKPFSRIIAAERESKLATALETRLKLTPVANLTKVFRGDCNECIDKMVDEIPPRALSLAFIDPENLNVDFETIKKLSACGQVDLLILFADRMDLVRNVDLYERQQSSVLDRMMGVNSQWRELWSQLANRSARKTFADYSPPSSSNNFHAISDIPPSEKRECRQKMGPYISSFLRQRTRKGWNFGTRSPKKIVADKWALIFRVNGQAHSFIAFAVLITNRHSPSRRAPLSVLICTSFACSASFTLSLWHAAFLPLWASFMICSCVRLPRCFRISAPAAADAGAGAGLFLRVGLLRLCRSRNR